MNSVNAVAVGADEAGIRRFLLLPLAWVALLVLFTIALPHSALPALFRTSNEAVKLVWLSGCLYAARAFQRGDYLRGAWLYFAASCVTVLLRDSLWILPVVDRAHLPSVRVVMTFVANIFQIASAWRFGRAWKVAELPDEPSHLRAYVSVGVVVVFIGVASLLIDVREAMGGSPTAMVGIASQMGDLVSLCMIAPVLPTALALRGGSLVWPWAMMAACMLSWIAYDAFCAFVSVVPIDDVVSRLFQEIFRAVASIFPLGSALAQRRVSARL